jgi:acyl-CoA thioester hydrolase
LNLPEFVNALEIGPILASTSCKFRIPLTYPDKVYVGARVAKIEDDRFTMEYCIVSHKHQKVAAEGVGLIVTFNYRENKKAPIPARVRQRIEELEASIS